MLYLDGEGTLQQQVVNALRTAINRGDLPSGSKLTPSRILADELSVSRNTIVAAYEQIQAEGYTETRHGSGTYVASKIAAPSTPDVLGSFEPCWSEFAIAASGLPPALIAPRPIKPLRYNFLYGEPGYADLPVARWARIVGKKAREVTERQLGYGPTAGLPELRQALADYLHRSRGVRCSPEQILLIGGTQEAIDLTVRALVEPGTRVAIEEPHYRGFASSLTAAGAQIEAIDVDDAGLKIERLKQIPKPGLLFTTPGHQFPGGSVMSIERRTALLEWAATNQMVIFEDDYDGEFRYEGKPIPAMQSLDRHGSVIYVGTASKILFPSLQLGWMVLPNAMFDTFERIKSLASRGPSSLQQLAFAEFVSEGHLERHLRLMRKRHAARRTQLLASLTSELGSRAEIVGTQAGIHLLLRLPELGADQTEMLVQRAAEQGVGVYPSAHYYSRPPVDCAELILGYCALTPAQIRAGIKRLVSVIDQLVSGVS